MNIEEAKAELTANDVTLDAMADLILARVAKFFGECVGDESFCAIAVDESRGPNGKLQSITLVPCDEVDGSPVRRVNREIPKTLVLAKA